MTEFSYTPVERKLAEHLCDAIGVEPDTKTWVMLNQDGLAIRTFDYPKFKAKESAAAKGPNVCYDRGDEPLPAWQAFIVQAREAANVL